MRLDDHIRKLDVNNSEEIQTVKDICFNTAFEGKSMSEVGFNDKEIIVESFMPYFFKYEPDNCFVVEYNNEIVGYAVGCSQDFYKYGLKSALDLGKAFAKTAHRLITGVYEEENERKYAKWLLLKSWRETPPVPLRKYGHFHFNILPYHRRCGFGTALLKKLFKNFVNQGVNQVFANTYQINGDDYWPNNFRFKSRTNGTKKFEDEHKYVQTTCWDHVLDKRVYLNTIYM
ncbi:GNAT family N-acetyltransferase, partial [Nanoarchaeota archaeon]